MQLKRATEYSLRYLICLAEIQSNDLGQYTTRRELNTMTRLNGKVSVANCIELFESPWIESAKCDDKLGYRLAVNAEDISVYDLICLTEYTTEMRSIFLKDGFTPSEELELWTQMQCSLNNSLKNLTIGKLAAIRAANRLGSADSTADFG